MGRLRLQAVAQWSCCLEILKYREIIESRRLEATSWISPAVLGVKYGHNERDFKLIKGKTEVGINRIMWQENTWLKLTEWPSKPKNQVCWERERTVFFCDCRAKRRKMADKVLPQRVRWLSALDSHCRLIMSRTAFDCWCLLLRSETWSPSPRPTWICWPLRGNWIRPSHENAWRSRKPSRNPLWYNF